MPTISIIGRGIDPARHLSLSAIKSLCLADKIVGIEFDEKFWKDLQREYGITNIDDLSSLYKDDETDIVNYSRFIDYIISLTANYSHLALLIPGHPRLGVTFINLLKNRCSDNFQIEIIEGISSFDTMINLIGIDPLEQGTTLLDANRLLLFEYVIEPRLAYFVYHICSVGNSKTNYITPSNKNRIDLLSSYLLKFYPKHKEVYLCKSSSGDHETSTMMKTTIIELNPAYIDYSTTLYIPSEKTTSLNFDFLNLLRQ